MGFSSLFAIGLSGVNAFATSLEAVSNNIANTQTTGFKRARTDFSTLIASELSSGGIEGGGASARARTIIGEQGAIARTANETNLAISGNGFFVVSDAADGGVRAFTRAGAFSARPDGALVNEAGFFLQGVPVNDGAPATAGSLAALETVNVNRIATLAAATSQISLAGNLNADAAVGDTVVQNATIFDDAGASRALTISFTNQAPGLWAASLSLDGAAVAGASGTVAFDADGRFDAAASSFPAAFDLDANFPDAVQVSLERLSAAARASAIANIDADGAPEGALTGVDIDRNGRISATFSNGLSRDIYQIALASFSNPEGLEAGAASTFALTNIAGPLRLDNPQSGRAGAVEAGALEISTVDIGQEFSTLIETQRAYSANTRVLTLADELLETLTATAR